MVSIVMATYDRASTLQRAIDSVLAQTDPDWELIIVDDGSTDETPEITSTLDDPRIRVYRHFPNRGQTAAKNVGFDKIRGEWFTILDSDDEMVPDALEAMLECAERTGATAITCNCLDTSTGEMSGIGPTEDGWLSATEAAQLRGEHWGITRTELLGDKRFDERVPGGFMTTVWFRINAEANRYYLNRALRIYHTAGTDRVTKVQSKNSLARKVSTFSAIGEDAVFLGELRKHDPEQYRHTILRVWAARLLRPFVSGSGYETKA